MRVLITGDKGFTGHYLRAELEAHDHEVFGLSCDLSDEATLATLLKQIKPEALIHLAAVTFVGHSSPIDFYRVNLLGTHSLLSGLYKNVPDINAVMLVSSANVYGNSEQAILTEEAPTFPANDYAVSKLAMEQMARLWIERLPLFIVRPFNYTGVGQRENFLIPKIVTHFKKKAQKIELGNLDVWREFGDVRVVAQIYRKLLERHPIGKTINVCTGEAYSLREVMAMASKITAHQLEIEVNPSLVRTGEVRMLKGDNCQLKKIINHWAAKPFNETLEWMLEQG